MSLVDTGLRWWLRSGRYRWSRLHRRLFEGKYLAQPLPAIVSLDGIGQVLSQVHWKQDNVYVLFDCVSYPQFTWARKQDDCDGFASLAAVLLNSLSQAYRPVLVTAVIRPMGDSHTVCVFNSADGLHYFSNQTLEPVTMKSYTEIAARISGSALRLVCWDVVDPVTLKTLEFHSV